MREKPHYLTPQDLENFYCDGFLILRSFYTCGEVESASLWIEELVARPPRRGREMVYYEEDLRRPGQKVLSRIEKFSEEHHELGRLARDERIVGRVSDLLGEEAVLFKEKINFKMPGGGGFAPHQDIQPGWDDYAPYFISVLVTIDPSTVENGCLELAAGHHKRGLIGRKWEPLQGAELAGLEFKSHPMEPGDVAFFDCFVPHQSKPNLTSKPRCKMYLTFNRLSDGNFRERYFSDKRKSYPPDFEREAGKEYVFRV